MKQGNQFYLPVQLTDKDDNIIDINTIKKVQFNIGKLTKTYDGISDEVIYEDDFFKIWLTEEETFGFDNIVKMDSRILFNGDDTIFGSKIIEEIVYSSLTEIKLCDEVSSDDTNEN